MPTPTRPIQITRATLQDTEAILRIQHSAYQREAALYDDASIPPLTQTLAQLIAEFDNYITLKASIEGQIVGAVRAQQTAETASIGRLMVDPAYQGQGIGQQLMAAIEANFATAQRYELFTGDRSERNLALYHFLGYQSIRSETLHDGVTLIYLEKIRNVMREGR